MTSEKPEKTTPEQIFLLLNEAQKLVVHVRPSSIINNTIDITALNNNDEADRPDPLRLPEVIIVICVLLLWCSSILIFIRHSELLRIRHRDLPYRFSVKPPMNLNHITVVNRTSDMVIHSRPRLSTPSYVSSAVYNHPIDEYKHAETISLSNAHLSDNRRRTLSIDSTNSTKRSPYHDEQFLDPYMTISRDVRKSLLDLHRKSMENLSSIRCSVSYSTNDISKCKQSDDQHLMVEQRSIQESPV